MGDPTSGPTPPPERPLPDRARARIRGELLQYAGDNRSTAPRWLVPAGAAAAVALVAGLAFWAVNAGEPGDEGLPVTGGSSSTDPVAASTNAVTTPPSVPETQSTTTPPEATVQVGTRPCDQELEFVLDGAQLTAQLDDSTAIYVRGDRFVLCDTVGGRTTVHKALPLTPRVDAATYAVSTSLEPAQGGFRVTRVAGGVVPDGVTDFDAIYEFPDGHVQHAEVVTDEQGRRWWLMTYSYHEDAGVNETKLPPIRVAVIQDAQEDDLSLRWGVDTCAQANHGC
ncbi:MAG TPA: hypothetical protein VFV89_13085 [Nocardioides sp.]|uniref:hypothetical protein n=1 Tax=Nocardioides sp. TaxID=35761 RepID=UPI002E36E58D|nr:hypothetical protein [Nocardioides sp.]HEX5088738.1 hypothetical protein [Nocardioides sp.]